MSKQDNQKGMVWLLVGLTACSIHLWFKYQKARNSIGSDDSVDVIESIPQLLCVHHVSKDLFVFSRRWDEYAGERVSIPLMAEKIVHPEDLELINISYAAGITSKQGFAIEVRFRRHDGMFRWHLVKGEFTRIDDPGQMKCISTSTDIHEQKLAEAEQSRLLKEVEAKTSLLAAVIDQMPMGVVIASPERKIISQNKKMVDLFSLGNKHKVGKLAGFKTNGEPVKDDEWVILKAIQNQKTEKMEFYTRDPEHGTRIFHASASPVFFHDGKIAGAVSIIEDITEYEKRAEKEIQRSQKFLEQLVENLPHIIFMKDAETFKYIRTNKACRDTFLDCGQEPVGKTVFDMFGKGQAEAMHAADQAVIDHGQTRIPRHLLNLSGGESRFYETNKFLIDGENGKKIIVGVSSDIHETVMMENKIIQAKEQAEQVARMKSQFLANMSHEIRTPLNGVIGITELILDGALEDSQRKFVHLVRDSGNALLAIVNDVLDFSKVESGLIELEKRDFELRTSFESHLEMLRMRAKSKEIQFSYHFDADVPKFVNGDSNRIVQVLNNLIGNAIKFTDERGEIDVRAKLRETTSDDSVIVFTIRDTGIGISPEEQNRLFKPFMQGDGSMARKYGGTGLGLSICKKLVELMGGEISIKSEKGKGSMFIFSLRLKHSVAAKNTLELQASVIPAATTPELELLKSMAVEKCVLLVEDNEINQMLAKSLLTRLGYQIATAKNGLEAVAAAKEKRYDLILMDCQMPELDGYEATMQIRELENAVEDKRVPIVALTANALTEDRDRCLSCGMDDFITKPINRSTLEKTLQKWLYEGRVA